MPFWRFRELVVISSVHPVTPQQPIYIYMVRGKLISFETGIYNMEHHRYQFWISVVLETRFFGALNLLVPSCSTVNAATSVSFAPTAVGEEVP